MVVGQRVAIRRDEDARSVSVRRELAVGGAVARADAHHSGPGAADHVDHRARVGVEQGRVRRRGHRRNGNFGGEVGFRPGRHQGEMSVLGHGGRGG
jgi:hypothetical protein